LDLRADFDAVQVRQELAEAELPAGGGGAPHQPPAGPTWLITVTRP
jgi:hypothetical protein